MLGWNGWQVGLIRVLPAGGEWRNWIAAARNIRWATIERRVYTPVPADNVYTYLEGRQAGDLGIKYILCLLSSASDTMQLGL